MKLKTRKCYQISYNEFQFDSQVMSLTVRLLQPRAVKQILCQLNNSVQLLNNRNGRKLIVSDGMRQQLAQTELGLTFPVRLHSLQMHRILLVAWVGVGPTVMIAPKKH